MSLSIKLDLISFCTWHSWEPLLGPQLPLATQSHCEDLDEMTEGAPLLLTVFSCILLLSHYRILNEYTGLLGKQLSTHEEGTYTKMAYMNSVPATIAKQETTAHTKPSSLHFPLDTSYKCKQDKQPTKMGKKFKHEDDTTQT